MRRRSSAPFQPVSLLSVAARSDPSILLRSFRETLELSVLAPDLFRLRIARGKKLSSRPSWSVAKTEWPDVPAQVRVQPATVSLQTKSGKLALRLADGSWQLSDASGATAFSSVAPASGFDEKGSRVTLGLTAEESLFGLGETTGTFNKRGLRRVFWNSDVLGHAPAIHPSLQSLYVSIPFALSLRGNRAAGLFWDNPARQTWDMGQAALDQWQMSAAEGEIDLYLFLGPEIPAVVSRFTELTGRMPLPPLWALGFHQCRYSYESRARIEEIARTFRRKKIPCDAIYLDIHHMDGYRVFTFGRTFPKPAQLIARLAEQGFKVVTIVDPGVKDEATFGVLKRGKAQRAFVNQPDGKKDYIGAVWPGRARFPDFTHARARAWWGAEQARLQRLGVAGFWNDMNEPANFALPTKTLPENCLHHSDQGLLRHRALHNVYGMQMARASREGALARQPDTRPFIITRAGCAGVQRHALVWTGDNSSVWEHLADSIQMLLNLSLSGVPFCGADAGGFLDHATGELLARWTQLAAFTPFFRNHSNLGTHPQEPWAYGPKVEAICKRHIELRYQLLPYLYQLFVEAHRSGAPIMRPLSWHHQDDPIAAATGDQFLLGASLLVAPILRQGATARSVYLPSGAWFDFWTGEPHSGQQHVLALAGLDRIPVYVRAGGIVPMMPVTQFIGAEAPSMITLHLWPGAPGTLEWYEDDGSSLAYARGLAHERGVEYRENSQGCALNFSESQGSLPSAVRVWRIRLHTARRPRRVQVDGRTVRARFHQGILGFEFRNTSEVIQIRIK